jgi:hypothetical protein
VQGETKAFRCERELARRAIVLLLGSESPTRSCVHRLCAAMGQAYETEVDAGCPQLHDFEIVRCSGHQHIGARCITMYNAETDERICQSCPVIGTQEGAHSSPRNPPHSS